MVWHEDEAFWERIEEFVFPPEKVEEATEQVEQLLALLDLDEGARVLDVPCGVGRHAVELARRGFGVTAVDATEGYLETARARARDTDVDVDIEFVRADMREFRREAAYDAVLNLYTSFGYFEDRTDDERVARNFYESLRPDGWLAMSLTSKEILARDFQSRDWHERDGSFMLEEREVVDAWSRLENRWIVVDGGDVTEFSVSHRVYSAFELTQLLERVGFEDVDVYGRLDGAEYDEDAELLLVVARK